jgi:hypothetical protein
MKKIIFILSIFIILLSTSALAAGLNISLADQGSGVTYKTNGSSVSGALTVSIWDAIVGGYNIYNETFASGIVNGSWNVMLGENSSNNLSLEYGKMYYKDYTIALEDADFTMYNGSTAERQFFYSPLGDIAESDISSTTNLTIGSKITFALGEVIDNIIDGFITITGSMNITNNLTVTDNIYVMDTIGVGVENPEETLQLNGTMFLHDPTSTYSMTISMADQKVEIEEDMNISFEDTAGNQFIIFSDAIDGVVIDTLCVGDIPGDSIPACSGTNLGQILLNVSDSHFYGCTGSSWLQLDN